uniref:Uncharacterized protein n=1 Tax=viral metagenome TaxID=1070528 RepID=A0A6C0IC85_9ZZZZ
MYDHKGFERCTHPIHFPNKPGIPCFIFRVQK